MSNALRDWWAAPIILLLCLQPGQVAAEKSLPGPVSQDARCEPYHGGVGATAAEIPPNGSNCTPAEIARGLEVQDLPEPSTDVAGPPARAPASDRVEAVREAARNRFSLASHKVNYVLPASYNDALSTEPGPRGQAYRDLEMQFQLSVQVPLWSGFLGKSSFVSLAYTNRSFWQAYSSSAPFREVNHEPELIMTWLSDWDFLGFQCVASQLGVSHQSNGRGDEFSRGWNRVYTNFMFERGDLFLNFQPWYRLPEDEIGDDNPDIEFYIGNFQLHGGYRAASHSASFVLRNNLRSDNRGSVELRWSFPIGGRVHGFVRYFNGYGDTLLDYNREQESLGLGIELARGL